MNDKPVLNKTADGKYAFQSQQHYDQTLEQMIANPTSMGDLQSLMNLDNVRIEAAAGGQPPAATPTQSGEPAASSSETTPPSYIAPNAGLIDRLKQRAKDQGVEFTYQNEDHIIDGLINKEKRIKYLNEQREGMVPKTELERLSQEKQELETRLKQLQETPPSQPRKETSPQAIESKRPQIDLLRKKIREIEDPLSEEAAKLQKDLNDLMIQELERVETIRANSGETGPGSEVLQMIKEVRAELKEIKDKNAASEATQQLERKFQNDLKAIEELQNAHEEFRTNRSMKEMDKAYRKWGNELFALRHKRNPVNVNEMNLVVQDYIGGDSEIQMLAKQGGLEEPVDMRKYLNICDLLVTRDQLDSAIGKSHTLEQVLVYKMARDGTINDVMLAQRQIGSQAIRNAQQNRDTNYARQLDQASGGSPQDVGDSMTIEQAMNVMNSITPERAARNPKDKELLDRATMVWKKTVQVGS